MQSSGTKPDPGIRFRLVETGARQHPNPDLGICCGRRCSVASWFSGLDPYNSHDVGKGGREGKHDGAISTPYE